MSNRASARTGRGRLRAIKERWIEGLLLASGVLSIVLIGLIFLFLFKEGIQALLEIQPGRFIGEMGQDYLDRPAWLRLWQPVDVDPKYSLLPLFCGSFLVALPAVLIGGVLGIGCAIYLSEMARARVREILKPAIELLAGIPTVVIGFLCLSVLATYVQRAFGTTFRLNAFVGALGVGLVIIPLVASIAEDALRAVPQELREAAYALGATRGQTIRRAVIPAAVSGLTAALLLALGRALGETMIVLMATGNAAVVTGNVFSSVRTMTATIAAELGAVSQGSPQYHALFLVGSILFSITFALNLVAEVVIQRMRSRIKL